ncbi:hypothetical protein KKD70_00840 [Patescibacteria group bacterium]|nr:hypothetical protein [Patescibacteria group bacterium]
MAKNSFYRTIQFQIKLYTGLSALLVILIGFYAYTNISRMMNMQAETRMHNQLHSALTETDKLLNDELQTRKEEGGKLTQNIQTELDFVFPRNENHTLLTRTLEQFENSVNKVKDPFMINNLQYLKTQAVEEKDYSILPIKATIHSSYSNFFKFLGYVEKSGTLADKTRLLNIQSISINFISPQGSQGNTSGTTEINFNVSMNAYFRS